MKSGLGKSLSLAGTLAAMTLAGAANAQAHYQQGRVISAIPVYESVRVPTQREVCWDEEVRYRDRRSGTPVLLGGLIGGAVGRQFGGGNGKDALTAVGAVVGASIANDVRNKQRGGHTEVQTRCRVANEYYTEERITGYRVRYEYNGQEYTTRSDYDPGDYIDLRVSVVPVSR